MSIETIFETGDVKVTIKDGKAFVHGKNGTVFTNKNLSDLGLEIYRLKKAREILYRLKDLNAPPEYFDDDEFDAIREASDLFSNGDL